MGEGKLRMYFRIIQHGSEHLALGLDVIIIATSELGLDVYQLQIHLNLWRISQYAQHQFEQWFLRILELKFQALHMAFRALPSIAEFDGNPIIRSRAATVAVRHTTDGKHCLIKVVHKNLDV